MQVSEFVRVFRDSGIRAELDWDLINDFEFSVEENYSSLHEDLARLRTVWYLSPDGRPGDYRNRNDRPMSLVEAVEGLDDAPPTRRQKITLLDDWFCRYVDPVQLVLPCYRLPAAELLILDGTHRAAAAYRGQHEFRMFAFILVGPVNSAVLPDLAHFGGQPEELGSDPGPMLES
jgi:hypothetical protein